MAPAEATPSSRRTAGRRPLMISADPDLVDAVGRVAAAAGVRLDVHADPHTARREATEAPLLIVGDDLAGELLLAGPLPRRSGVVLLGRDLDDASVWQRAVTLGAEEVLFLPDAERYLAQVLADVAEGTDRQAVRVCVVGGRGGAGASTLACALAVTGARSGIETMLVDGDPLGGGIDLVLGEEGCGGMRWPALVDTRGRLSGKALKAQLPTPQAKEISALSVLSWDRGEVLSVPAEAMRAVLDAGARSCELVVVDLPRHRTTAADEALAGAHLTVLVVPAEVRAVAAAGRVLFGLRGVAPRVEVVVRGPAPSRLPAETIAASLGVELIGEVAAEPGLPGMLERGQAPPRRRGPLAGLCADLVAELLVPGRRDRRRDVAG
jgi:secretion/DNA translocation related CpaE-like protein